MKKSIRLLTAFLLLALLLCACGKKNNQPTPTAPAPAVEPVKPEVPEVNDKTTELSVGIVTGSGVRLRTEGSTDGAILGELEEGTVVLIMAAEEDWYKVRYSDMEGYMSADYVDVKSSAFGLTAYGRVISDSLSLCKTPHGEVLQELERDTYVNVTGFEQDCFAVTYQDVSG